MIEDTDDRNPHEDVILALRSRIQTKLDTVRQLEDAVSFLEDAVSFSEEVISENKIRISRLRAEAQCTQDAVDLLVQEGFPDVESEEDQ